MNYGEIKNCDIANGEGVRVSLFVSGCTVHCPGCFNEETWDFSYGEPFTPEVEDRILAMLEPSYIAGLSVLGGEPFERPNQEALLPFLRRVKEAYPNKSIWVYTGRMLDADLMAGGSSHTEYTDELLELIDVLVDGPFIEAEKDPSLAFCGSANQRVIDMEKTRRLGETVPLMLTSRDIHWHNASSAR